MLPKSGGQSKLVGPEDPRFVSFGMHGPLWV